MTSFWLPVAYMSYVNRKTSPATSRKARIIPSTFTKRKRSCRISEIFDTQSAIENASMNGAEKNI